MNGQKPSLWNNGSDYDVEIRSDDGTDKDALFIATYNTAEGGTLRKYYVGNNPDKVELKADPTAVWKGLTKVKNMSWRAVL